MIDKANEFDFIFCTYYVKKKIVLVLQENKATDSKNRIVAVGESNINDKLRYSKNGYGLSSSSLYAHQDFPKPTCSSNDFTDLPGDERWKQECMRWNGAWNAFTWQNNC